MKLVKITQKNFDKYYALLEQDFCFEERKTREDEYLELLNKKFKPYFIYENNQLVGYFTYWEFDEFLFGEHFAILKDIRNNGIGTQFLIEWLSSLTKPFVFEVECAVDEVSFRRIKFYKRNGIKINTFNYYQPSYHNGKDKIKMHIASYPNKIYKQEFNKYNDVIRKEVYKI